MSGIQETIGLGEATTNELLHYGVPGMKWGVRKAEERVQKHRSTADRSQRIADGTASRKDKIDQAVWGKGFGGPGGPLTLTKPYAALLAKTYNQRADKLEAKVEARKKKEATKLAYQAWKKEANGAEMANKAFRQAAKDFESTAKIINEDPTYKGKDVTKGLLSRQYQATMNHYFNEHLAQASIDLTYNPALERAYIYQYDYQAGFMRAREVKPAGSKMKHDALPDDFELPDYRVELDDLGHMVGFSVVGELKHYGVPGMKWGVRKDRDSSGSGPRKSPVDVTTKHKPGGYVKAKGGQNQDAHPDAVRARTLERKAKKSTTDSLSNQELNDLVNRMNLEVRYDQIKSKAGDRRKSIGVRLLEKAFKEEDFFTTYSSWDEQSSKSGKKKK